MTTRFTCISLAFLLLSGNAMAADSSNLNVRHQLPVKLAVEAAVEAMESCNREGYHVTATIVGIDGQVQVVIKGDGAPPHTAENSYNKAYTVVSLGPLHKAETTSAIAKAAIPPANPVGNWPNPPSPLPGITFSAGGVAIKTGDEVIGGLGVSGAPGGQFDEACATNGVKKSRTV